MPRVSIKSCLDKSSIYFTPGELMKIMNTCIASGGDLIIYED